MQTHAHIHTHTHTNTHTYTQMHKNTHTDRHIHTCKHMHTITDRRTHMSPWITLPFLIVMRRKNLDFPPSRTVPASLIIDNLIMCLLLINNPPTKIHTPTHKHTHTHRLLPNMWSRLRGVVLWVVWWWCGWCGWWWWCDVVVVWCGGVVQTLFNA